MKLAFTPTTLATTCPACDEPFEILVTYRSEGLTMQDDGSPALRVAVEADLAAIQAHAAAHDRDRA
jgi:hypothetical protein